MSGKAGGEEKREYSYNEYFFYQSEVKTPQEYLQEQAGELFARLDQIAICESGYHIRAYNNLSGASGIFQFLPSTWHIWGRGDVFNFYENIDAAIRLYKAKGSLPWVCK